MTSSFKEEIIGTINLDNTLNGAEAITFDHLVKAQSELVCQ